MVSSRKASVSDLTWERVVRERLINAFGGVEMVA
jgi:hypothetical protein